jgi:hypothetical protein
MRKLMHQKKGEVLDNIHSRTSLLDWSSIKYENIYKTKNSWARGLVQTLYLHREVLLIKIWQNRFAFIFHYLLYEFAVPILEALGLLALLISIFFYDIDFNYLAIGSASTYFTSVLR